MNDRKKNTLYNEKSHILKGPNMKKPKKTIAAAVIVTSYVASYAAIVAIGNLVIDWAFAEND